ncbi:MAG: c-type cytochrome [Planctomycetes bacterium]|nr:c-type cytochrome [Planctomycetota bacterium]
MNRYRNRGWLGCGRFFAICLGCSAWQAAVASAAENQAGKISLPEGFRAELVYKVPMEEQGSWVSLTVDDRGRLIASDQYGALYRIEPSAIGGDPSETKVERIDVDLGGAQGLLFHDGALYVVVSTGENGGLYRVTDTNNDDQFDKVEQLFPLHGAGEHGPHAIILAPDGKSLYLCAGNHTKLPELAKSRVPQHWGEDQLLPRIEDPGGHAVGKLAPAGWVCKLDFDGKNLELISAGYRNEYDIAFNTDGELFTFDADMEWDVGAPWYRPTRVCHVLSGSDYGWRSGNAKWPTYFPETLPPVVDIGPGSPTGICFGAGSNFPKHYQKALLIGDWSYGKIYAVNLRPNGASYTGTFETFAMGQPMAVTDMLVRPQDGALYFAVGGRRSESALYRIVYDGQDRPAPEGWSVSESEVAAGKKAREIRRHLETLHTLSAPEAVERIWPHLASEDRFIRSAARIALEFQPADLWRERALAESNANVRLAALLALVRSAPQGAATDLISSLTSLTWESLTTEQQLELLRIAELVLIRSEKVAADAQERLAGYLLPKFPSKDHRQNRELIKLLVRLEVPQAVPQLLKQLRLAVTPKHQIDYALALSVAKRGWTLEGRKQYFEWLQSMTDSKGGHSYFGYLKRARDRFIATFSDAEKKALKTEITAPFVATAYQPVAEMRPLVKKWKLEEVVNLAKNDSKPHDFTNGRRLFSIAQCSNCHRIAGEGSSIGPDLTGAGRRLSQADLLRAIVEPSHQVSDQYQQMVFETNGRVIVGRILNLSGDNIHVSTNMADPDNNTVIKRDEIDDQYPSDISVMPMGLLDTLDGSEILDILTYLRAGGEASHELYKSVQ